MPFLAIVVALVGASGVGLWLLSLSDAVETPNVLVPGDEPAGA